MKICGMKIFFLFSLFMGLLFFTGSNPKDMDYSTAPVSSSIEALTEDEHWISTDISLPARQFSAILTGNKTGSPFLRTASVFIFFFYITASCSLLRSTFRVMFFVSIAILLFFLRQIRITQLIDGKKRLFLIVR